MISKSLQDITAADLDALVANAVAEDNQLDFKQASVGGTRDEKKEFVADVCAFANTQGGDLVFGMQEDGEGRAQAIVPLSINPDDEILRLENIVADSLEPKLFGLRAQAIAYGAGYALVVRVPKSVQGIHRNKLDERFWIRESRSKRALDVAALAQRFQGLGERRDRLDQYLAARYAAILTDQLPLGMREGPKLAIHIFQPFTSVDQMIDVQPVSHLSAMPMPTRPMSSDFRMTYEGPMHHSNNVNGTVRAFTLTHHNGIIEGVAKIGDPDHPIGAEAIERTVVWYLSDALPFVPNRLSIDYPLIARFAIVGGVGTTVRTELLMHDEQVLSPIRQSAMVLPDILISDADDDIPVLCRPAFDRLWHASGYLASMSYRDRGDGRHEWSGQR